MIKRNKYKMLAAALSTSFLLSACGSVNTETGGSLKSGIDDVYAHEFFEETSVSANEEVLVGKNIHTDKRVKNETDIKKGKSEEPEIVLPPNMTMDDLLNMIQINGKILSMPTTLNDIMALGDEFSYEMAFSEYYQTPEDSIEDMDGVFYDIYYNEERICQIVILKNDYTGDVLDSKIKKFSNGFGSADIQKSNVNFLLSCGIDLESTVGDVEDIFGEPNNNSKNRPYVLGYRFYDQGTEYNIDFSYIGEENGDFSDELASILIKIKTKE